MSKDLTVFVVGFGGVFLGMMLLYISIRNTSLVTRLFEDRINKEET